MRVAPSFFRYFTNAGPTAGPSDFGRGAFGGSVGKSAQPTTDPDSESLFR